LKKFILLSARGICPATRKISLYIEYQILPVLAMCIPTKNKKQNYPIDQKSTRNQNIFSPASCATLLFNPIVFMQNAKSYLLKNS